MTDGRVVTTTPVAVTIVPSNPGFRTRPGTVDVGLIVHGSSSAAGIISVDGSATAGDVATITVQDRSYSYTVVSGDTLDSIRDNLIGLIKPGLPGDGRAFRRLRPYPDQGARPGPGGQQYRHRRHDQQQRNRDRNRFHPNALLRQCGGRPGDEREPGGPGEVLIAYATGLGLPTFVNDVGSLITTGVKYPQGAPVTAPPATTESAVSSLAGGKTADVISATLLEGSVGTFKVILHLNSDIPTDPATKLTIAQNVYVSNVVTFPVVNPAPAQ